MQTVSYYIIAIRSFQALNISRKIWLVFPAQVTFTKSSFRYWRNEVQGTNFPQRYVVSWTQVRGLRGDYDLSLWLGKQNKVKLYAYLVTKERRGNVAPWIPFIEYPTKNPTTINTKWAIERGNLLIAAGFPWQPQSPSDPSLRKSHYFLLHCPPRMCFTLFIETSQGCVSQSSASVTPRHTKTSWH